MHKIALLAAALLSSSAMADDRITWQHPTQRVNGAAMLLSEIRQTIVKARNAADTQAIVFRVPAPDNILYAPRDEFAAGTVCYSAATVDTAGLESNYTPEVCKTTQAAGPAPSAPGAPVGLAVD